MWVHGVPWAATAFPRIGNEKFVRGEVAVLKKWIEQILVLRCPDGIVVPPDLAIVVELKPVLRPLVHEMILKHRVVATEDIALEVGVPQEVALP